MLRSEYEEISRLRISEHTEIVLSATRREGLLRGYSITKYVTSTQFIGFSRGVFVPKEMLANFLRLFPKDVLQKALDEESPSETTPSS